MVNRVETSERGRINGKQTELLKSDQFISFRIYYKRETSKDLLGKVCFKFCKVQLNF